MTRNSFSVRVERPGKALGEAMSEIRSWLDAHKIEPPSSRPIPRLRVRRIRHPIYP
jgi:hypothetical protein